MNDNTVFLAGVMKHYEIRKGKHLCILDIPRKSSRIDSVPVVIDRKLQEKIGVKEDDLVLVSGTIRSRNTNAKIEKSHLEVFVQADEIEIVTDEIMNEITNSNFVQLKGVICKKNKISRKENFRPFQSVLLAYNNTDSQKLESYYLPCVFWGENAEYIDSECDVGDELLIVGRFISRMYIKRDSEDNPTYLKTYEISVREILNSIHHKKVENDVGSTETNTDTARF